MIDPEKLTKERIQRWLDDRHGGDREWLAAQMGISGGGLAHCFSRQGFSARGRASVARLMELDEAHSAAPASSLADQIQMSQSQWERFEQAREYMGNPERPVFIRECILHHTETVLNEKKWQDVAKRPAPQSDAYYDDGAEKDRAAEDGPETLGGQGEG